MRIVTIDCSNMNDETEYWDAYVAAALPEGRGYFGCNLDAFWDAVSAGGPGWPGEDCELRFINTAPIKTFREKKFYDALKEIAKDSDNVPIYVE
jgi:ribonuclease inhibitor